VVCLNDTERIRVQLVEHSQDNQKRGSGRYTPHLQIRRWSLEIPPDDRPDPLPEQRDNRWDNQLHACISFSGGERRTDMALRLLKTDAPVCTTFAVTAFPEEDIVRNQTDGPRVRLLAMSRKGRSEARSSAPPRDSASARPRTGLAYRD